MPPTAYYHPAGPIDSLKLRVTLVKAGSHLQQKPQETKHGSVGTCWQQAFQWQQKVDTSGTSDVELFSYTDDENPLLPPRRLLFSEEQEDRSHVSWMESSHPPSLPVEQPTTKQLNMMTVWQRGRRETKVREMHIMAKIQGHIVLLVSLRYWPESGLLRISPELSPFDNEGHQTLCFHRIQSDAYQEGGPEGTYEVAVEELKTSLLPMKVKAKGEKGEWRKKLADIARGSSKTKKTIEHGDRIVTTLAVEVVRLVSIQNRSKVWVDVELIPVSGIEVKPPVKSTTHVSQSRSYGSYEVAFGFLMTFNYILDNVKCMERPRLRLQVYSIDKWGRITLKGHADHRLPASSTSEEIQVPLVKSIGTIEEEMENYYLGMDRNCTFHSCVDCNRVGLLSRSTGAYLILRLNQLEQTQLASDTANSEEVANRMRHRHVHRRSVEEIVKAVRQNAAARSIPS